MVLNTSASAASLLSDSTGEDGDYGALCWSGSTEEDGNDGAPCKGNPPQPGEGDGEASFRGSSKTSGMKNRESGCAGEWAALPSCIDFATILMDAGGCFPWWPIQCQICPKGLVGIPQGERAIMGYVIRVYQAG